MFRKYPRGELRQRHFQRKEPDGASNLRIIAIGLLVAVCNVERDIRCECRFAHGRPAGEDEEVGTLKPSQPLVQIGQSCRQPRKPLFPLCRVAGFLQRQIHALEEQLETCRVLSGFRQREEFLLGVLDQVVRGRLDVHDFRSMDHLVADAHQAPPHGEVPNLFGVVAAGMDGKTHLGQPDEIHGPTEFLKSLVLVQEGLQSCRIGNLAAHYLVADDPEDLSVQRIVKMLRLHDGGDPLEHVVVDQETAQERLFKFNVGRRCLDVRGICRLRLLFGRRHHDLHLYLAN